MKTTKKSQQIMCGSDLPQEQLVKTYAKTLSKDKSPMHFDKNVIDLLLDYAYEEEPIREVIAQADSIGFTTSKYEYDKIEDQIKKFESKNVPYFGWNRNFKKAKDFMSNHMRKSHLRSIVYKGNDDMMLNLPKKDTHAGASWLVTGLRKKGEYAASIFEDQVRAEKEAKQKGSFNMPLLIGTRTQASMPFDDEGVFLATFKSKSRLVSMVDIKVIMAELKFAKPLQQYLSLQNWYAGGKNDFDISGQLNAWRVHHRNWLSIDYSSYDQSISDWLIREAFDLVKVCFSSDPNFDQDLFKVIVHDFCNKSFIDGEGRLRYSCKGVPSGSMFTQIIDTLVNRLMIMSYMFARDISPYSYDMMIMGDDNIIFYQKGIDREDLEGYLNFNFGVQVNASKSSSGTYYDDPEFLSRFWSHSGPHRQWKQVVTKLAYPERFRDYRRGKAEVHLVLYSYIMSYRPTMMQLMDVSRFESDYPNLYREINEKGVQGLSGYLAYVKSYSTK